MGELSPLATQAVAGDDRLASRMDFLRALFGSADSGHIVLWRRRDKRALWLPVTRLNEAAEISTSEDVYVAVALHDLNTALKATGKTDSALVRGCFESAVALPGLYGDFDIRGPAHQRKDLPRTEQEVRELIGRLPLRPTVVLDSGHGLQAWWLFKEFWVFDGAEDRERAQGLLRRFQATFQSYAGERGWALDNTANLAWVLRLPETLNAKLAERVPVEIVEWYPEDRYNPSDVEPYLVDDGPTGGAEREGVDTAVVLAGVPQGQRDTELFRLACKLRRADVPREYAERMVLDAASRCAPPFPEKEARAKVAGAYERYPAGGGDDRTLATFAALAEEPPRPLHRELPPAGPFPTEALGEILALAARAIHEKSRAPDAICGQSVLAATSLAVQGFADVELPTGAIRPLSTYLVTVAASGERKTSADELALQAMREREKHLAAAYAQDRQEYENALAAWEQQRRQDLGKKNSTLAAKKAALEALGPRPEEPLIPLLTCPEPTFEGLTKLFANGWPSLGVFSAEGGQFIGGHGMNPDNRLKTAAALSGIWDGDPLKRVRAGDKPVVLPGRRLAVHLLIQPGVATGFLSDPLLADQGLLSRFLVAAPDSSAGTRFWCESSEECERSLRRYHQKLAAVLATPLVLAEGTRNELKPRVLRFSLLARQLWIRYADHVEKLLGAGGEYESIRGFANKLAEHAARLAGVIALIEDLYLEQLTEAHLARGIELANFYAQEALRLVETGATDPDLVLADRLLQWMRGPWPHEAISLPDIYQRGPAPIRDQKTARKVTQLLQDHGWLIPVPGGAEVAGTRRREAWRIVRP